MNAKMADDDTREDDELEEGHHDALRREHLAHDQDRRGQKRQLEAGSTGPLPISSVSVR